MLSSSQLITTAYTAICLYESYLQLRRNKQRMRLQVVSHRKSFLLFTLFSSQLISLTYDDKLV